MGGRSSSSQQSQTSQIQTTNTHADYSQGDGDRINTTVTGNNNTTTDYGAIKAGADVAKDSIAAVTQGTQAALNFGKDALSFADTSGQRATDVVKSSLTQVSNFAAANEAGNRDTVKTLSDLAMNLKSDGAAQQTKTVQTVVIGLAIVAGVTAATIAFTNTRKAA